MTECPECHALVAAESFALHEDWHYAIEQKISDLGAELDRANPTA